GMLVIGRIDIGSRCFIGTHSALGINAKMEDDSYLDDMSLFPEGAVMKSGEARRGSPAEPAEVNLPRINEDRARGKHPLLFGLAHFLVSGVVGALTLLSAVPPLALVLGAYLLFGLAGAIVAGVAAIPLGIVSFCLTVAGIKALLMRRTKPGVYPVESWFYVRRCAADRLVANSTQLLSTIFTTIYLPPWLRLLGAKIGKGAEIATVT